MFDFIIFLDCKCDERCPKEQQLRPEYALALRQMYDSLSSESEPCNSENFPENFRDATKTFLSLPLGLVNFSIDGTGDGINGFICGFFSSHENDIMEGIACALYGASVAGEHGAKKGFYDGANSVINYGN